MILGNLRNSVDLTRCKRLKPTKNALSLLVKRRIFGGVTITATFRDNSIKKIKLSRIYLKEALNQNTRDIPGVIPLRVRLWILKEIYPYYPYRSFSSLKPYLQTTGGIVWSDYETQVFFPVWPGSSCNMVMVRTKDFREALSVCGKMTPSNTEGA